MGFCPGLFETSLPTAAERRARKVWRDAVSAARRDAARKAEARRGAKWDRIKADFARARLARGGRADDCVVWEP